MVADAPTMDGLGITISIVMPEAQICCLSS